MTMPESKRLAAYRARASAGGENEDPPVDPATDTPAEANPPAPEPETPPEKEPEPMPDPTPVEQTEAYQAGFAAANARMNTVFASEHATGREAHAARLLGRSMSADDILAELPNFAKAEQADPAAVTAAAEEAARKEMAETMAKNGNVDLGADHNNEPSNGRAKAAAVWDRANAKVEAQRQQKGK